MIHTAITRANGANEWLTKTAAVLAAEISQPAGLKKIDGLTGLFRALVGAGATAAEFSPLWNAGDYLRRVELAISNRDYSGLGALFATMPADLSDSGKMALGALFGDFAGTGGAFTASIVEMVADETGEPVPDVDAAAVESALNAAGWSWSGSAWERD